MEIGSGGVSCGCFVAYCSSVNKIYILWPSKATAYGLKQNLYHLLLFLRSRVQGDIFDVSHHLFSCHFLFRRGHCYSRFSVVATMQRTRYGSNLWRNAVEPPFGGHRLGKWKIAV